MAEFLTALLIAAAALWVTVDSIADGPEDTYCIDGADDERACVYGSDD